MKPTRPQRAPASPCLSRRPGRAIGAIILTCSLALAGCADSGQASRFKGVTLHDDAVVVRGVVPIIQTPDVPCGPACLACVAAYWDRPVTARSLQDSLGPAAPMSAHSADNLAAAARVLGLRAYAYQGGLDDLDANLNSGRPVIVLIKRRPLGELGEMGMDGSIVERIASQFSAKQNHWIVVVGSDKDHIIAHDPALGAVSLSRPSFDSWWSDTARMSLLVVPQETASASVPVDRDK